MNSNENFDIPRLRRTRPIKRKRPSILDMDCKLNQSFYLMVLYDLLDFCCTLIFNGPC